MVRYYTLKRKKGDTMRKLLAFTVTMALVMSCAAAYAGEKAAAPEKESMVRTFFGDAASLFRKQIPETPKSQTNRMWERTEGCAPKAQTK